MTATDNDTTAEDGMSDITQRLRKIAQEGREIIEPWQLDPHLYDEAADEIERLRATKAAAMPTEEEIEEAAKIIYDAFPFDGTGSVFDNQPTKPAWHLRGNSEPMQHRARRCARAVLALLGRGSPDSNQRDIVLEEAAKIAEAYDNYSVVDPPSCTGAVIATALRWMKSQSTSEPSTSR